MPRQVIFIALLAGCSVAFGQYKCVDKAGKTSFQQTPCLAAEREEKVRIFQSEPTRPAVAQSASAPLTPDQKILLNLERDRKAEERARKIKNLGGQIDDAQESINRRNAQMEKELVALRQKKTAANNNLAGATWEQSISMEMQAVTQKYKTLNDTDFERLKLLRADLEVAKATK